ncbi:hypothetical protein GCM10014715_24550 [Streptomyces spiralis]|uniref:Uncharacterized protein n=1 Tax=Streptomyces spiralis TaxID=66376 RepID=A0A918ZTN0_9ACTN|nr:hypothetical protein GCM10014715_24550 [Streptomyces spiralis]
MPTSRLETTACPIPAEASTTTDSVVAARMAQRGLRRGTGAYGTPSGRCGTAACRDPRRDRAAGRDCGDDRGGVVDMQGHLRIWRGWAP